MKSPVPKCTPVVKGAQEPGAMEEELKAPEPHLECPDVQEIKITKRKGQSTYTDYNALAKIACKEVMEYILKER